MSMSSLSALPMLPGFTGSTYWRSARLYLTATKGAWHAFYTLRCYAKSYADQGNIPNARLAAKASRDALQAAKRYNAMNYAAHA